MNAKGGSLALDMGFDIILCEKGLTAAHVKSKACVQQLHHHTSVSISAPSSVAASFKCCRGRVPV